MKNILLPTDFSDNSWNAIKYAIKLYKNEPCTFHLFHAYTPIIYNIDYMLMAPAQFGLSDPIEDAAKESLSKLLAQISNEFGANSNHTFKTIARFDTLVSGVMDLIQELKIDLIVMGTKGDTGAKEVLFGSNTVQVFNTITCPILAVPSDFEYDTPHEILFPTDLEINFENVHLEVLKALATTNNSRINVLHVSSGNELTMAQIENQNHLATLFEGTAYLFHDVGTMELTDAINEFQVKHKINLLAMVNNKHSIFENLFFKNTIRQIGFHLNIPFLVIPNIKTKNS
ncbi:universal stress protein [Gelidibacter sp.]|uniref:universal stress protein n=1 Tax=Gelidibacter sp. TaxID=2018083 RepID=UPI003267B085